MHDRVLDETSKLVKQLLDEGISDNNNLEYLGDLIDVQKDVYEIKCMKEGKEMYGNYGNNYGNYGDNYGRYMYGRERYGNSEDTKKSLKYMLESMEDFAKMLREEAQSQEEVQMIRETAQRISQM